LTRRPDRRRTKFQRSRMVTGPSRSPALSIAIVDRDPLLRHGLRMRLAAVDDIDLVGEAADGASGIDLVRRQKPELILIGLALPDRSGIEVMRETLAISPETRVIMLAAEADERTQLQALREGAAGFLLKSIDLDVLPQVLRGVKAGEAAVSRALAMRLLEEVRARES
jgi:DNA-binding NarL/FixJ family response regulator